MSTKNGSGHFDLCIVGAGYAGLNAAFVASRYLPASARVVMLDKHWQAGGMWNKAYPYVRLHQPHQVFTAGNIPWTLGRHRSYLATRDEVAAHLRHCFDIISKRLDVDARWGWEYLDHCEDGTSVEVTGRGPAGEVSTFTEPTGRISSAMPTTSRPAGASPIPCSTPRGGWSAAYTSTRRASHMSMRRCGPGLAPSVARWIGY